MKGIKNIESIRRFLRENAAEEKRNVAISKRAMYEAYGFSEEQSASLLDLGQKLEAASTEYHSATFKFLTNFGKKTNGLYSDLTSALVAYSNAMAAVKSCPLLKIVEDRDLTNDELEDILLRDPENDGKEHESLWDLAGWYPIIMHCSSVVDTVDRYVPESRSAFERIMGEVKSMVASEGPDFAELYFSDFIATLRKGNILMFADNPSYKDRLSCSFIADHADLALPIWKRMAQHLDSYKILSKAKAFDFLKLFPIDGMRPYELATYVAAGVFSMQEVRDSASKSRKLLETVKSEERFDLFDILVADPSLVDIGHRLHNHKLEYKEFAEAMLNLGTWSIDYHGTQITLIDIVKSLANSSPETAACIVSNAGPFVSDDNPSLWYDRCKGYGLSFLLLRDYFDAMENMDGNRMRLAEHLAALKPDAATLKEIRSLASKMDTAELGYEDFPPTAQQLLVSLRRAKAHNIVQSNPAPIKRFDWFELEISRIESRKGSEEYVALLRSCYTKLDDTSRLRLRNIWNTQPDSLRAFAEDVVDLSAYRQFQMILDSHSLFEAYKQNLLDGDKSFSRNLRKQVSADVQNPYSAINRLLMPEVAKEEEEAVQDLEVVDVKSFPYERVIICGGDFIPETIDKIRSSVKFNLEFCDHGKRKRDIQLDAKDAVVWITLGCDHPSYYSVKGECKIKGAGFYHYNQPGYTGLINFLGKLKQ